jgi:hypothetical protein
MLFVNIFLWFVKQITTDQAPATRAHHGSFVDDEEDGDGHADPSTLANHKAALEMYAFLLLWLVGVGEKIGNMEADETAAAPTTKGKRTTSKTSTSKGLWPFNS